MRAGRARAPWRGRVARCRRALPAAKPHAPAAVDKGQGLPRVLRRGPLFRVIDVESTPPPRRPGSKQSKKPKAERGNTAAGDGDHWKTCDSARRHHHMQAAVAMHAGAIADGAVITAIARSLTLARTSPSTLTTPTAIEARTAWREAQSQLQAAADAAGKAAESADDTADASAALSAHRRRTGRDHNTGKRTAGAAGDLEAPTPTTYRRAPLRPADRRRRTRPKIAPPRGAPAAAAESGQVAPKEPDANRKRRRKRARAAGDGAGRKPRPRRRHPVQDGDDDRRRQHSPQHHVAPRRPDNPPAAPRPD